MAKDDSADDAPPKKKKKRVAPSDSGSGALAKLRTWTRALAIAVGLFVSTLSWMGVLAFVSTNMAGTLVVALIIVIGIPTLLTDRLLKKYGGAGGLPFVGDVFAVTLMVMGLAFVTATPVTKHVFRKQGDRFAEGGARGLAWVTYTLGGYNPTFPDEKTAPKAAGSASAPASSSGGK